MNPPSILVIDDEPRNFDVIESLLSIQNYDLHYASTGKEALESLALMSIDLILLDVMMPEMDGIEVCYQIKAKPQWQSIPIIMVTASTAKEDLAQCLNVGADDFISKPVHSLELRARVHSMLRIKKQFDEIQMALKRQAILEAEKIEILENRNFELEKQVEARTAALKATAKLISHNALHDPLTDLPNRRMLLEHLELSINKAKQLDSYRYAVLFLDLDNFKVINDSLGHLIGDKLLIKIVEKLKNYLPEVHLLTRFGGDEFVILLEYVDNLEEVIKISEGILANFQNPIKINENDLEMVVGASIGIVWDTADYSHASDLLRDADIAMYKAKLQGRNSYQIFDTQMHNQALRRLTLEADLRKALEQEQFVVYYQPIIDILNNALIGFEALVRWQHPIHGFVSPTDFISISEETGLIVSLDTWVFNTSCKQLATWKNKFPHRFPLKMTINLSVQDLRKPSLIGDIDRTLEQTGLSGDSITLEITESMLIDNINKTIDLLTQLQDRKIQISIDDFGTGYSSLNYLHRLPADYLKIDRSFINQIEEGNRNYQLVSTIIILSNQLGLKVIAEGIETPGQLKLLKQLKCEFGQGYLFSKPLAAKDIETKFLV